MPRFGPRTLAAFVLASSGAAALGLYTGSPAPRAETRRGSEQAFVRGLEAREIEGGALARRWAGDEARITFVNLPEGPLELEVEVRSQRHPVRVSARGVVLGTLAPGAGAARYLLPSAREGALEVRLRAETFVAGGGRSLGFLVERVSLRLPPSRGRPPAALVLWLLLPTGVCAFVLPRLGVGLGLTAVAAALLAAATAVLLWPYGLVFSPYARELPAELALGIAGCAVAGRGLGRLSFPDRNDGALCAAAALFAAFLVQGVAAAHPCLVASDAVFHAHNLRAVSLGDFHLTSLTPHDPPFRFPYGVSFYVLLVPSLHTGLDATTLVRALASASALAAAAAAFTLAAPLGPVRAGLAVCLLQVLPTTFDLLSAGNYTNVFAQSVTLLFLAWWAGRARGGATVGGLLLLVAATAHFGGVLLLGTLAVVLVAQARGRLDSARWGALAVGLGLAALYYLGFLDLMFEQAGRLAGGGGQAGGSSTGLVRQLGGVVREWGLPIVLLAVAALVRRAPLPAPLWALALAGLPFFAAALVTPLEVRYLYAMAPAVAALAAGALVSPDGLSGRGRWLARLAGLAQVLWAVQEVGRGILERYRS